MIKISHFAKLASFALICSANANAAYITETLLPNDSFSTAQFIPGSTFTLKYDSNIDVNLSGNYYTNRSTSIPHASILGTGDTTVDYFSFQASQGSLYLDIDNGIDSGGSFDSWLELYDSSFNLISSNDDARRDSGSAYSYYDNNYGYFSYDSFIKYQVTTDDLYYVLVGGNANPAGIPFGSNYTLNISNDTGAVTPPVPLPASIWLFMSGILGLFGISRRR